MMLTRIIKQYNSLSLSLSRLWFEDNSSLLRIYIDIEYIIHIISIPAHFKAQLKLIQIIRCKFIIFKRQVKYSCSWFFDVITSKFTSDLYQTLDKMNTIVVIKLHNFLTKHHWSDVDIFYALLFTLNSYTLLPSQLLQFQ